MTKLKHHGERSLSYATPVEWNKLDVEIRSLSNLETFKKKVKTYLFNIALILICILYFIMFLLYICGSHLSICRIRVSEILNLLSYYDAY